MKTPIIVQQQGESDCGVACLLSIIRHFGGDNSLEKLRELSGTSLQGTSMLGLFQAAEKLGMKADAFEVEDFEEFKKVQPFPAILHVVIDEKLEHYVVCYESSPFEGGQPDEVGRGMFVIGDPAKGIEHWTEETLLERWKTRSMLQLSPTESFEKVEQNNTKKWLWFKELIKEDLPLLSIAAILGIFLAALGMATAIFSQKLIDDYLPHHKTDKLFIGLGLLALILLFRVGIGYIRTFFLLRQSRDFNTRIANSFYESLLHLPKTFFDSRKTGELIARMNDTRRIQSTINYLVGNVVIDLLVTIISLGFIFTYSVYVGFIALLALPFFGFLVYKFNARIIQQQKEVMAAYARTESNYVDTISGIATIKATNREGFFTNITQVTYNYFQQNIYNLGLLGNRYNTFGELINTFLVVAVLGLSSWLVFEKQIKLGEMMAVVSIATGLIGAIARLATTNIQLQEAKVAFDRMYEFSSVESEKTTDESNEISKIKHFNSLIISNLSFRFAGRTQLLKNVSLKVNKGEVVALLGEVGSGKSILFQILQKFILPESGAIIINDNIALHEISLKEWRNIIGVVQQDVKIFNGTLLDNIILGNIIEEGEKAIDFCKKYGFSQFFETLPQGYITIVGEEGINLSGGQKQLVALARALYR